MGACGGKGPQLTPPSAPVDPDAKKVAELVAAGFPESVSRDALMDAQDDLDKATELAKENSAADFFSDTFERMENGKPANPCSNVKCRKCKNGEWSTCTCKKLKSNVRLEPIGGSEAGDLLHLQHGISKAMLFAFLHFAGMVFRGEHRPPEWYGAGFPDVNANDLENFLTGYEICELIRDFMRSGGWVALSVVELLKALGANGVGMATVFLSHSQAEPLNVTLRAMGDAEFLYGLATLFFVDYVCIRQLLDDDFKPDRVRELIGKVGHTVLLLTPRGSPWALGRVWCVYEILSTLSEKSRLSAIPALTNDEDAAIDKPGSEDLKEWVRAEDVKVENCQARRAKDKDMILSLIDQAEGGRVHVNQVVGEESLAGSKTYFSWRSGLSADQRQLLSQRRNMKLALHFEISMRNGSNTHSVSAFVPSLRPYSGDGNTMVSPEMGENRTVCSFPIMAPEIIGAGSGQKIQPVIGEMCMAIEWVPAGGNYDGHSEIGQLRLHLDSIRFNEHVAKPQMKNPSVSVCTYDLAGKEKKILRADGSFIHFPETMKGKTILSYKKGEPGWDPRKAAWMWGKESGNQCSFELFRFSSGFVM